MSVGGEIPATETPCMQVVSAPLDGCLATGYHIFYFAFSSDEWPRRDVRARRCSAGAGRWRAHGGLGCCVHTQHLAFSRRTGQPVNGETRGREGSTHLTFGAIGHKYAARDECGHELF